MSYQDHTHRGHHRSNQKEARAASDLKTMEKNNYFYGQLLGVLQFEREQEYFNAKRRIINRLVIGPGVVCGLDVKLTDDGKAIVVGPGLAIDRHGNEIIVPTTSRPVELPEMPEYDGAPKKPKYWGRPPQRPGLYCEIPYAHVVVCYHECKGDPTPAMAGDCETVAMCASGSIREQYVVEVRDGFAPKRKTDFPKAYGGQLDYDDLVEFVTRKGCRELPPDGCIPLANIHLKDVGDKWEARMEIAVRPIVYTNRLLYQLIQSLMGAGETPDAAAEED